MFDQDTGSHPLAETRLTPAADVALGNEIVRYTIGLGSVDSASKQVEKRVNEDLPCAHVNVNDQGQDDRTDDNFLSGIGCVDEDRQKVGPNVAEDLAAKIFNVAEVIGFWITSPYDQDPDNENKDSKCGRNKKYP